MSADVMKTGTSSELDKFKASVTNTSPEKVATGTVLDHGLFYVKPGDVAATVWSSNVTDLDGFQLKLNREKIVNINRAYRFEVDAGGKIPFKTIQLNTMAMRMLKWATPALKVGDKVDLYVWRNGAYVQYGYKKAGQ